ncbi:cation-translocating P-type ATPase [Alicyclobacillus tolerans]|uniref:heavy metal translocating P-type ATPase n=1 Tax=Alicyclobacillus tolerans TaxID=90970 RepID=UPI001F463A1A|nr:cation-translocating P-type ATPase [Alicyclobacillus tolerans]MCF8567550.1 cation-translocating P-type ATPase [Alicyclobacillus tolerans]
MSELKLRSGLNWARAIRTVLPSSVEEPTGLGERSVVNFHLSGLTCASCGILVEHVVHRLPGVVESEVSYPTESLIVSFDPGLTTPTDICETVSRLGYSIQTEDSEGSIDDSTPDRSLIRRLAVALTLSLLLMMASVPIWSGYLPELPPSAHLLVSTLLWALTTPIVFWAGWPFLHGAWTSLRHRVATVDLLVSAATLAAYFYSVVEVIEYGPYLYFDACGFLIAFLLVGRLLEFGTRSRALAVTRGLSRLTVSEATVVRREREEQVPVKQLRPGDFVLVRPGGRIPVDGVISEGTSDVDESFLTGESLCVAKVAGDYVYAGTLSYTGRLIVRTTREADDTVLAQTLQLVRNAQAEGQVYRQLTERVLRLFVPGILVIGILTFCLWEWITPVGTSNAILRAVATLVIACPCALSVASPVASQCAVHLFGEQGVLLRSDEAIERGATINAVVFDKTGTLTQGRVRLLEFYPEDPALLRWAASAEAGSEHPFGKAVVEAAQARGLPLKSLSQFTVQPGDGITATVEGHEIAIRRYAGEWLPPELSQAAARKDADGQSLSILWMDGFARAVLFFSDTLRADARETVNRLLEAGVAVHMATGDRSGAARQTALDVGIQQWRSDLTPVQKSDYITALQREGLKVAYVGDGINDAAALLQSDLGIAMGSGTDIAIQAGHFVLTRTKLAAIPLLLTTCRETVTVTRQNLAWAIGYNLLALVAAVVGFASPAIAAAAMVVSSAFVLGNSLKLLGSRQFVYVRQFGVVIGSAILLFFLAWYGI